MVDVLVNKLNFLLLAASPIAETEAKTNATLPEPVRQIAYMALLGIALLGMLMIVATLLGGHWVRRWGDRVRRSSVPPDVITPRQGGEATPESPSEPGNKGDTLPGTDTTVA